MASKTHFKKYFNSDYLGAWDLDDGDLILTIGSIKQQEVKLPEGKKNDALVCRFQENVKPMILNVTNCKLISKVHGTRIVEEWIGKKIQVYATEVKAFGDLVDAIRVRPFPPKTGKAAEKSAINKQIVEALANLPDSVQGDWKKRLQKAKADKTDTIPNLQKALKAIQDAI